MRNNHTEPRNQSRSVSLRRKWYLVNVSWLLASWRKGHGVRSENGC